MRGTVYAAGDGTISIRRVSVYDSSDYKWKNIADTTVNVLNNTIAIEKGRVIDPSSIKKALDIRIIKRDRSTDGDAYIIIVE